jgi:hypothetical protein
MPTDNYSIASTLQFLTGTTSDRSETVTADDTCTQSYWVEVVIAAGAADTSVALGGMTDPKILVVYGGNGVTFKLGAAGTDSVGADPIAVVGNENNGLNIAAILVSNSGAQQTVGILAAE